MARDDPAPAVATRPTVRLAGQDVDAVREGLVAMRLAESEGGMSSLELTLLDWRPRSDGSAGYAFDTDAVFSHGTPVKVYAGATLGPQEIFDGTVTAIEVESVADEAPTLTLLAEDKLWRARGTRRSRVVEGATPADLVRALAADLGLTPDVRELTAPASDWVQSGETDLAFIRRILARFDADLAVVGDKLQAGPRGTADRGRVELSMGTTLISARITADLAEQVAAVRVSGFDEATGEPVTADASDGDLGPGAGPTGPETVARAFTGWTATHGHHSRISAAEAAAMARAEYGRRARRFVTVDAVAGGDARLRVGTTVVLQGVNPRFATEALVTATIHRFDLTEGYLTEFRAEAAHMVSS